MDDQDGNCSSKKMHRGGVLGLSVDGRHPRQDKGQAVVSMLLLDSGSHQAVSWPCLALK